MSRWEKSGIFIVTYFYLLTRQEHVRSGSFDVFSRWRFSSRPYGTRTLRWKSHWSTRVTHKIHKCGRSYLVNLGRTGHRSVAAWPAPCSSPWCCSARRRGQSSSTKAPERPRRWPGKTYWRWEQCREHHGPVSPSHHAARCTCVCAAYWRPTMGARQHKIMLQVEVGTYLLPSRYGSPLNAVVVDCEVCHSADCSLAKSLVSWGTALAG